MISPRGPPAKVSTFSWRWRRTGRAFFAGHSAFLFGHGKIAIAQPLLGRWKWPVCVSGAGTEVVIIVMTTNRRYRPDNTLSAQQQTRYHFRGRWWHSLARTIFRCVIATTTGDSGILFLLTCLTLLVGWLFHWRSQRIIPSRNWCQQNAGKPTRHYQR